MIEKFLHFVRYEIWRINVEELSRGKSFLIKKLRVLYLTFRGFSEDKCALRASALTFYSLLAIVPIFAMAFGIAKGFGYEKRLEAQLQSKFVNQEEVVDKIIEFSNSLLANTEGEMVAGIGLLLLFWSVLKLLGNIESAFNDIWGVKKSRSFGRKTIDYLFIFVSCVISLIISSSVTVFIASQVTYVGKMVDIGAISYLSQFILKLTPYIIIVTLFSLLYIFMPNIKVNKKAGITAGIIAGCIYQLVQSIYIHSQIGVAKYNAIYGSFAALPLFLVWLQFSWLIVMLGAEISFAYQNVETYEFEPDALRINYSLKKLLTLQILHLIVKNFHIGAPPYTACDIRNSLDIPIRLIRLLLYELVEAKVLNEVHLDEDTIAYQPAHSVENLSIQDAIEMLEKHGTENVPYIKSDAVVKIKSCLNAFNDKVGKLPENMLLKNI